jgi:uncharacterized metal-binding protein
MANYKTHVRFNLFLALPVLLGASWAVARPSLQTLLLFSSVFAYATLFFSPDLDLAHQIKLFSLRGLLTLPFRLYSMIFRHRGISHHPLFGTITRLAWMGGCFYAVLFLFFSIKNPSSIFLDYRQEFIYGISAIFCADLSHLLLD